MAILKQDYRATHIFSPSLALSSKSLESGASLFSVPFDNQDKSPGSAEALLKLLIVITGLQTDSHRLENQTM